MENEEWKASLTILWSLVQFSFDLTSRKTKNGNEERKTKNGNEERKTSITILWSLAQSPLKLILQIHVFFSRISRNATWRRKNVFRLLSVVVPRSIEKTVPQKNHFRLLSDNRQRGLYAKKNVRLTAEKVLRRRDVPGFSDLPWRSICFICSCHLLCLLLRVVFQDAVFVFSLLVPSFFSAGSPSSNVFGWRLTA